MIYKKKGVPSAESSRSVRGLGKGVSGKPYPRLCNARYIVSRQNYYILTWLKNAAHVASVTCFFDRKTSVTGY